MRNRVLYLLVAILVLLGLGFYLYNEHQQPSAPATEDSSATAQPEVNVAPPAAQNSSSPAPATSTQKPAASGGAHFSGESDVQGNPSGQAVEGNDIQVQEVDYDGASFSPSTITINQNDYIFFKNNSKVNFWPQSSTYTAFNAGAAIAPGKQFQFQFTKAGTWAYADHLNPAAKGTVIVKK